jgi:FkbM family methyltransferase
MVKYFLDCGTNLGQGLTHFNKKFNLINNPEWVIYCFEPNKYIDLKTIFPNANNIIRFQKAVWNKNEILKFKIMCPNNTKHGAGSKLDCITKMWHPDNVTSLYDDVEAIDFSEFLNTLNGEIIVKMDIEGSEFNVMDHLIKTNTISKISEIFVETHGRFMFDWCDGNPGRNPHHLEIQKIETDFINKISKYIPNVHKWD